MEPPVEVIEYDEFRTAVVRTLLVLSDPDYQRRVWIRHELPPGVRYDELKYRMHILFDDMVVLPDPQQVVGALLYSNEVDALSALGAVLDPLLDELGNVGDAEYLAHPHWPEVVRRAADAYRVMHANDEAHGTGRPCI